jgi:hypothetical protein
VEKFPSRGHTGQGGERAEADAGGFQRTEAIGKNQIVQSLSYGFSVWIHAIHSVDSRVYM